MSRFINSQAARQEEAENQVEADPVEQPVIRSLLVINGGIEIPSTWSRPNAWRRFWQWLLLGWTWEEASDGDGDC